MKKWYFKTDKGNEFIVAAETLEKAELEFVTPYEGVMLLAEGEVIVSKRQAGSDVDLNGFVRRQFKPSVFVVWNCSKVVGVCSTLEKAKILAERKANHPKDGVEYLPEWEDEQDDAWTLWATYPESDPNDLMYISKVTVDA